MTAFQTMKIRQNEASKYHSNMRWFLLYNVVSAELSRDVFHHLPSYWLDLYGVVRSSFNMALFPI